MRKRSILLIQSDLKWWTHLITSLFIFQLLGECHCWWTRESLRTHVAKFYGWLRLIRSVWELQNFPYSKSIEIVILWVHYTIPFGCSLLWHFWGITFQLFNYFVWIRITDEISVPELLIWSILLIKSDLKWHAHLCRSLFIFKHFALVVTIFLAKLHIFFFVKGQKKLIQKLPHFKI